jgi:predicted nucleic acid-binding protein
VSDSSPTQLNDPEYAFLDANVIRGQLTTDILLTLAEHELLEPFWSQGVIDEMRRNRPAGVTEQRIDRRIDTMNEYFPAALISGHDHLIPEMQADPKDKHVLAAAVHGQCDVLVTDNGKDSIRRRRDRTRCVSSACRSSSTGSSRSNLPRGVSPADHGRQEPA